MSLARTILRPVARAAAVHAGRQLGAFLHAHRQTAQVQQRLLREMIAAAAGSRFGRDHGFAGIRSYADFASAVPVGDYETHRPYLERVLAGETEALFGPACKVVMFAVTSGTTGAPKHIPVTKRFLRDYARGWNVFGLLALRDHPQAWLREIVTIASSARESFSPAGIPCGSISGLLAEKQKWIVRRMYPVPPAAREIHDPLAKYYTILRASIARDVGMLTTANPSSAVRLAEVGRDCAEQLIRDVHDGSLRPPEPLPAGLARRLAFPPDPRSASRLERLLDQHGQLLPRHYWKLALLCHWTGGTIGLYLPRVRELFGEVPIRDIGLLASEGRLSVPLADGTSAGAAEITAHFLEFIPAGQIGALRPDVLTAEQVEVGQEYFLVLTNWAGLWRYNLDDRVLVTGRLGSSPVFEFLCRGLHTSSITGEKLTEHQVVEAMGRVRAALETFVLQGHFAAPPYYHLSVEPGPGIDPRVLAGKLDEAIRRVNVEYDQKRRSGRLGPIRASCLPPGSFARREQREIAARRGRAEQYKHTYLLTDVITDCPGPQEAARELGGP